VIIQLEHASADVRHIVETAVAVVVGGIIAWVCAWYYYKRAGDELRDESVRLRRKIDDVLIGLERAGLVHLKRGVDGETMIDIRARADLTMPMFTGPSDILERDKTPGGE
jgi:hypothetical protein